MQVTLILSTKFRVNLPFGLGEAQIDCQDGHRCFFFFFFFFFFDFLATVIPPTKFRVSWPFGSGK